LATPNGVPQVRDVSLSYSSLIYLNIVRALRSTISPKDHEKIKALHGDFGKLKEEFDRAVNVEALSAVKRIGKY
jgi:cyclopropane fatty-acyl-phospholipid synthase-like methyltransferase